MTEVEVIDQCKKWLQDFVIKHGLCPFASQPFLNNQIRYVVIKQEATEEMLMTFWSEVLHLKQSDSASLATTLLIFPNQLSSFESYLDIYNLAEALLEDQGEDAHFQLASFHPDFQFAGTTAEDVTNYTNRSPFPIIHILRADEVEAAIAHHPDTSQIPERNMALMIELGIEEVRKGWK